MTTRNPGSGERVPTPMASAGRRGEGVATNQDARRGTAGEPAIGSEAASGAMSAVGTAVEQAKEKTGELVDQATEQAKPQLESRKEQMAEGLGSTAHALRQTSRQLREQEAAVPVAEYAERAAARVDRLADHLRERDLRELIGEVEDFARRQPVLFVGGAFTLGLFAARFLKSSGERGAADTTRPQAGRRVAAVRRGRVGSPRPHRRPLPDPQLAKRANRRRQHVSRPRPVPARAGPPRAGPRDPRRLARPRPTRPQRPAPALFRSRAPGPSATAAPMASARPARPHPRSGPNATARTRAA
jgi:hypothetical protein